MKILKYNLCTVVDGKEILSPVEMGWNEVNEETAKKEAYNGEYTIEDDGQPDPVEIPSQLDRVESQVAYLAMMTGNEDILEV